MTPGAHVAPPPASARRSTATPYFDEAGFRRIDRASAPAAVAGSEALRSLCPASAVCMELVLAR